jgi:nucleoside diphosphate kinase
MTERTLIIVQRHLAGEILARFERKGLKLVAAKLMLIPEALARRHHAAHQDYELADAHWLYSQRIGPKT